MNWSRHVTLLLGTFAGLVVAAALLIWIGNPYGNMPFSPTRHVLMDDNQRFQYPAVIRSRKYDSIVIGTSTARLLEPARLDAALGGRFANLALNSGTAWEQMRIARLFTEVVRPLGTLIVAADHVWCARNADTERITRRGFPEWMFDHDRWNDLAFMLNTRTVEIAGRRVGHALGLARERWPHNGYEIFVPPEHQYDAARAKRNIYQGIADPDAPADYRAAIPDEPPFAFPAMAWLDEMLDASNGWRRIVIVVPPPHLATFKEGLARSDLRRGQECKEKIREVASRRNVTAIDFRIDSEITSRDEHYWDGLHYRVPIATRIVDDIEKALATGRDDPKGDWKILHWAGN